MKGVMTSRDGWRVLDARVGRIVLAALKHGDLGRMGAQDVHALDDNSSGQATSTPREDAAPCDGDNSDVDGAQRLLSAGLSSWMRLLPQRIGIACAADAVPVVLADGSSLSLDEAERLLARKEERAAHAGLRGFIGDAVNPQLAVFNATLAGGRALSGGSIGQVSERTQDFFLDIDAARQYRNDTADLAQAARDVLHAAAGEGLSAHAFARALDLPDDSGAFTEATTRALLQAAREAARPILPVARFRAPRLLAGVVLFDGEAVRFAQPPLCGRWRRHGLTVCAGTAALAAALGPRENPHSQPLNQRPAIDARGGLGRAMALGLLTDPVRRQLGASRRDAERAARVAAATLVLELRAAAALAACTDLDEAPSPRDRLGVAHSALNAAYGSEPDLTTVLSWLIPPFGEPLEVRTRAMRDVNIVLEGCACALALRAAYDETFALRPEAWQFGAALQADNDAARAVGDVGKQAASGDATGSRPGEPPNAAASPTQKKPISSRASALINWAGELL